MNKIAGVLTIAILLLSGCAAQNEDLENQTEQQGSQEAMSEQQMSAETQPDPVSSAEPQAMLEEILTAQQLLEQQDSPLAKRVIYFEYDSAKVNDESLALLEAHGNFIAGNGDVTVRLEGHTDERGSREYNIALGDRRAQSVRRILLFQGASTGQLDTISYGEEQAVKLGHDEAAWSMNRRVELVYDVR
jgi:peptidoglycan-associated lipoprotein